VALRRSGEALDSNWLARLASFALLTVKYSGLNHGPKLNGHAKVAERCGAFSEGFSGAFAIS